MQVIFDDNDLFRAAVMVANDSYSPLLFLARKGGRLRIIGSNGCVLVSGEVDADFVGWEDGRPVLLRDCGAMEALKRALKRSGHVAKRVEVDDGYAGVHIDDECAGTCAVFINVNSNAVEWQREFDEVAEVVGQEPGGACVLGGSVLEFVAKVANVVSRSYYGWVVEQHGPEKPVVMKYDGDTGNDRNIFILAMPMRLHGKAVKR